MMRKVFKYHVAIEDYQTIEMPEGAKILTVERQYGRMEMWALVDPEAPKIQRKFRLAGTGHAIDDQEAKHLRYVGTCILGNDNSVYHLFEIMKYIADADCK